MKHTDAVKEIFNSWALSAKADSMAVGHEYSVNEMLKQIPCKKIRSFLDIGCGNGWTVRKALNLYDCNLAYGIDLASEMIQLANSRKTDSREHYLCTDICNWECEEKFDLIFSMEALYYIENLCNTFKKIHQLLKQNGIFIMGIDFYEENPASLSWPERLGLSMNLKSIVQWQQLFKENAFSNIATNQIKNDSASEDWKQYNGTLVIMARK